ncbi:Serpentine receptor class r-10 [Caenorhabditis elegans]|uniref:Serpentine receptor class r-10 n=1 Tax=Caenorhabditis elegans TaxID=6239 RepID=Q22547_CAEEL|nr:Seven TM Receptor [Caenorhabditis elegans]CCD65453.1 Seven TM Receptor [Caenorhabditis elegans]|eukprot:NP_505383.2 Seven TM Receptor [Caenorhabditis elegans]
MDLTVFNSFLKTAQFVGTCIANPLNIFLIYLILTKSSKKIGNYKYLMIYVSIYEILFSCSAIVTEPLLHSFTTRVIVIVDVHNSIFSREICSILDCLMCAMYGVSMNVFALHFLYRYATLFPKSKKLFDGARIIFWLTVPQIYGVVWLVTYYAVFRESPEYTEFIRKTLMENLDINVDDVVYVGPYYYMEDKNGIHDMDWTAFWAMAIVWLLIMSSAVTVFICGYGCYKKITKGLEVSSNSKQTKSIQKQLFYALVVQSAIPFLLMYIPSTVVLFCTLIQLDVGSASLFISYSIAIYPVVDPLPTLFIVQNYRNAVKKMITRTWNIVTRKKDMNSSAQIPSSNKTTA